MSDTKRKLAAIVFTDIVGFTKLSSKNEPAALALLEKQRDLLKPLVEKNNGEWLKEIGDGLLLSFGTTRDAVDCAIEIQHLTKEIESLDLRIGIHQGEVVFQGSDVVGDDVNIASRIEPFAANGGIAISGRVNSSLERDPDFETKYLGTPDLKGVDQEVKVYCITSHGLPETDRSDITAKLDSKGFQWNLKNSIGIAASTIGLLLVVNVMFLRIGFADESEVPSIAILPLENKGAEEDDFYAYGISTDLISDVASAGLIRVASLKEIEELEDLNFKEKAKRLLVRYVAQGSIWKRDNIFQLSMELYDTKNEKVLWSERWQKDWAEIPQVRDLLSDNILKILRVDHDSSNPVHVSNPEAYEYYLKAKHKYEKLKNVDDLEIVRGLLNKAIEIDDDLIVAKNLIGHTYSSTGDGDKAMSYYTAALKKAEKLGDDKGLAGSFHNIADYYSTKGELDTAKLYLEKALDLYVALNDKDGMGNVYISFATHYWQKEDLETAVEYDKKSLKLYEELGDIKGVAVNLVGIGIYYSSIKKDHEEAVSYYERAQNIFEENGYKKQIPYSLQNLASAQLTLGKFESAINNYDKLVLIMEELGYGQERIRGNLRNKAYAMSIMGDYEGASKIYENNLEFYEELDDKEGIFHLLRSLGISNYLNQNHKRTLEYFERANELSKEIEFPGYELTTELYLNLCYKYFDQKIDLKRIQDILKETEDAGYTTNFHLYELLGDKVYLESAHDKIQEMIKPMNDTLRQQFLDYPLPRQIMKAHGKVIS